MKKLSKRQKAFQGTFEEQQLYPIFEALQLVKKCASAKFDETVEVSLRLGVDPRKADQMVRGACSLPHGLGKDVRVLVFAKGEKAQEAIEAGADFVGDEDLIEKIQKESWFEFDRVVATPNMMGLVGKIGRFLGTRGLMPNPKLGTVTLDVASIVKEIKSGKIEFRVDKHSNLHAPVGRASFQEDKLKENVEAFLDEVKKLKPSTSKGVYMKSCSVSSTMGPGIKVQL